MTARSFSSTWLAIALALLAGCARTAQRSASGIDSSATPPAANGHTVDSLMARYDHPDGPGGSVVVIQNGKVVYTRSYGL
ncbi:MAG TPA: hypothetical protein VFR95_12900, partial [Gemmatimonadaceae bacterium]|nr:hypothetical protein [Gemmatimonadaceae bacterium]